ncbi:hypothetical protein SprV_0100418700 [Sparganum proliferum]
MFFEERNCNSNNAMAEALNFSRNAPDLSFIRSLMPPDSELGAQTRELAASIFLSLSTAASSTPCSTLAPNRLLEQKSQHTPISVLPTFVPNSGDPAYSLFLPFDRRANSDVENTQAAYEQAFLPKAVDRMHRQPYAEYHLAAFQRALDHLALLGLSNNRQSPSSGNNVLPNACSGATNAPVEISIQKTECPPNSSGNASQLVPTCQSSTSTNVTVPCSQNECQRTSKFPEERRSRVIIHQIGGAEDHFSKALQGLQTRNTARVPERSGWQSCKVSKNVQSSPPFRSHIWTVAPEETQADSEKIQNIADLAVEKHFEKALANFRTTGQQTPKSPLDLSCPVDSIIDVVSSPIRADHDEVQDGRSTSQGHAVVRPIVLSSSARSFESGISGSEASNSSPGSGCSYKPKKNWLAQYGWRKQGASTDFSSCLSWDSGDWYLESGCSDRSVESLKDVKPTRMDHPKSERRLHALRAKTEKDDFGKLIQRKRTSSVPCLTNGLPILNHETFQLNSDLIDPDGRNSTFSSMPYSSSSSSPNNARQKISFFSESSSDDEAPVVHITNVPERRAATAQPNSIQHQRLLHSRRPTLPRTRSETVKSDSADCLLHREPQSAITPDVSPTATSGFFTNSSFSLDLTLPTVSEDNLPGAACDAKRPEQSQSFTPDCQHHRQRTKAPNYSSKYWTIRKRAASDANHRCCLKRSRSLAVDKMAREIPGRVDTEEAHKYGALLRLIVSHKGTPTYGLAKWLFRRLKFLTAESDTTVSSSAQFLEKLKGDLAIETIEMLLQSKYDETENRLGHAQILQILKFSLRTYFTFDKTIYEQVKGTPLGSPISGFIAEAVLQRLVANLPAP